jgi:CheY-like chemotaxis protein
MTTAAPILVVDDDRDVLAMIQAFLEESGYRVVVAMSGAAALLAMQQETPACILLDLRMPEMNGAQFLNEVKQRTAQPPAVIVVSAGARAREEAEELGVQGFLAQPFDLDELLAQIRQHAGEPR